MGYERKRGKLAEFNALLRCPRHCRGERRSFAEVVGDTSVLPEVRYVITLDTDTQLPRDSARQMVGAMAHPLNRPVFDPERRRVVAGYGILQPRVGVSLPSAQRSWFVRLFAGDAGVDPYTRVVSDVYQDLFGEGSFIGKGIYDVDAFEQCCGNFPENAILSHDLLEGTYVRSALLSDVELYEEFPSRYPTDVSRRHRWMRGDWQIAWWLLPWVPALDRALGHEPDQRAVVVEDLRQPPPQPGAGGDAVAAVALLAAAGTGAGGERDALRAGGGRGRSAAGGAGRPGSQAGRPAPADAPARDGQRAGQTVGAVPVHVHLPPLRGVRQPRRDRANPDAHALDEDEDAGVEDLQRRQPRGERRPAGLLPVHVVRAGDWPSR